MGWNILKIYNYNKLESMDKLKNLNPVGYKFIKNLENHNNDLTDYVSEEKP